MQLAFYRADAGGMFDHIIGAWTHSQFAHVELVFDGSGADMTRALCFSSSSRDGGPKGTGGTRFKHIDLTDGKWVLVPVPSTLEQEQAVIEWCKEQLGKKY